MKKPAFLQRLKWRFSEWVWRLQRRFVPEFVIKAKNAIYRFDKDHGFGKLELFDWERLEKELNACFEEQSGIVINTLQTQKKMENELFRMGHASAWRFPEDNTLPYTPPDVVRIVLADGRVLQQKIEIE